MLVFALVYSIAGESTLTIAVPCPCYTMDMSVCVLTMSSRCVYSLYVFFDIVCYILFILMVIDRVISSVRSLVVYHVLFQD